MSAAPGRLTDQQVSFLLQPINGNRVRNLRGMSHLEAWDVRRQLIRIFGFEGFAVETQALDLVHEHGNPNYRKKNKAGEEYGPTYTAWTIVYRAQVRLTVKTTTGQTIATFEDAAAGDAVNQPSVGDAHDLAMKTALSQALKRCAVNLGDQFGLSLYNDGSRNAVVMRSLAYMGEPVKESEDAPVGPEQTPEGAAEPDSAPTPSGSALPPPEPEPQHTATAAAPPQQQRPGAMPTAGPGERQGALDAMWEAARAVNFTEGLPAQFQTAFGHPIEQGTVAEFRQARDLMTGSNAA
ncbi:Rad52/Rad22 family DNA repair protein [Streptomyces cylindrosporus]|uniref:Rad52/Rad22 family DNA repair protein n=1 Tax=Streptomyces cylindrosporus TaxID=2927583 RepID=A0ABS9Y2K7_9ACTN|nr:Rad52/Rad22 family DNA repair protein [Streptomyces cylindrosporus]MCI3271434.1 Rad52/Rad22 family DNA repair protein [Streptomyces cylindrosporus]